MANAPITVIGAGLAGSEVAFQLARLGHDVVLREQKPLKRSPAHQSDGVAELVCSNSMRSDNPESAIGMLHAELRRVGSVILHSADAHRVPAGDALAVEREGFSGEVRARLMRSGRVTFVPGEVTELPEGDVVVATGPLTSEGLTAALARYTGGDDYLNLPLSKEEYTRFVAEVRAGQKVTPHAFEEPKYFEGCLPIEVMAERGEQVLAFGPMKPVGLVDPRTGKRPWAVVQLRMEDRAGTAWNLVGFQSRLTWGEQKRIFGMLPGLQNAEWLRMGQIHRNTFLDSPRLLAPDLSLKAEPRIFFAGQITGVEGYVESAACGYLCALAVHARRTGSPFVPPPGTTALGALYRHVTGEAHPPGAPYQPTNVVFALFPPLEGRMQKAQKRQAYAARARVDFDGWAPRVPHEVAPAPVPRVAAPRVEAPVAAP
ncbi:MAG: methylenetetrahydrofolate--tRNA-(uracil(54)-C(5))-methyltransferase (FADH(2)-oxidizing) TrmFO [Myxococcaceae bacterium]|nr:methylenetetrahydrofolate--tRNA-(uracil(54)-C(5))-methyltransferase (FADH(2)-oxidizing) TrmFO [Myxococcaceae bacterium]